MNPAKRLGGFFISTAVVLALGAGFMVISYLNKVEAKIKDTVPLAVVRQNIPARTVIGPSFFTEDRIEIRDVPIAYAPQSAIIVPEEARNNPAMLGSLLNNAVTMIDLEAGDILQRTQFDRNAGLGPDMRAVSIAVNQATSVGGAVRPGQHVDVIVSYVEKDSQENERPRTALLLQNVEVLAVFFNSTTFETTYSSSGEGGAPVAQPSGPGPARFTPGGEMMRDTTVTLALSMEDAMRLTYMSNFAKEVRLVIRRPEDQVRPPVEPVTPDSFR